MIQTKLTQFPHKSKLEELREEFLNERLSILFYFSLEGPEAHSGSRPDGWEPEGKEEWERVKGRNGQK